MYTNKNNKTQVEGTRSFLQKKDQNSVLSSNNDPFIKSSGKISGGSRKRPSLISRVPLIQPKLTIGQPGDKYEQEADDMAEKVMRMPKTTHTVQKDFPPDIQACGCQSGNCQCGENGSDSGPDELSPSEITVQRKETGAGNANPSIESQLNRKVGNGQSLPNTTQQQMESSFGQDFSQVNIHTDADAVQMNQKLNAQAFTSGSDIYFNQGKYQPGTSAGDRLLAHELTHTIQQNGSNQLQQKNIIQRKGDSGDAGHADKLSQVEKILSKYSEKELDDNPLPVDQGATGAPGTPPQSAKNPEDIEKVKNIWLAIPINQVGNIIENNSDLWNRSTRFALGLGGSIESKVKSAFEKDVLSQTTTTLKHNEKLIQEEMEQYGLVALSPTYPSKYPTPGVGIPKEISEEQMNELKETAALAETAHKAFEFQAKMRQVQIGYKDSNNKTKKIEPLRFDPQRPPVLTSDLIANSAISNWEKLKKQWDATQKLIDRIADKSPSLYAAVKSYPFAKKRHQKEMMRKQQSPIPNLLADNNLGSTGNKQITLVDERSIPLTDIANAETNPFVALDAMRVELSGKLVSIGEALSALEAGEVKALQLRPVVRKFVSGDLKGQLPYSEDGYYKDVITRHIKPKVAVDSSLFEELLNWVPFVDTAKSAFRFATGIPDQELKNLDKKINRLRSFKGSEIHSEGKLVDKEQISALEAERQAKRLEIELEALFLAIDLLTDVIPIAGKAAGKGIKAIGKAAGKKRIKQSLAFIQDRFAKELKDSPELLRKLRKIEKNIDINPSKAIDDIFHLKDELATSLTKSLDNHLLGQADLHAELQHIAQNAHLLTGKAPNRVAKIGKHTWKEGLFGTWCRHSGMRSCTRVPPGSTLDPLGKLEVNEIINVQYKGRPYKAQITEVTETHVTYEWTDSAKGYVGKTRPAKVTTTRANFFAEINSELISRRSKLRDHLMNSRPSHPDWLVEMVWKRAKGADGKVRGLTKDGIGTGPVLEWKADSRAKQWHMGHRPGKEYHKLVDQLDKGEINMQQFMAEYHNPDNYWPEFWHDNVSHKSEIP